MNKCSHCDMKKLCNDCVTRCSQCQQKVCNECLVSKKQKWCIDCTTLCKHCDNYYIEKSGGRDCDTCGWWCCGTCLVDKTNEGECGLCHNCDEYICSNCDHMDLDVCDKCRHNFCENCLTSCSCCNDVVCVNCNDLSDNDDNVS